MLNAPVIGSSMRRRVSSHNFDFNFLLHRKKLDEKLKTRDPWYEMR
jgi:hypothetical protein